MSNFNSSRKELSMAQQTLNAMTAQLSTTSRTSPDYLVLLQSIENLQYSMHRARIIAPIITKSAPTQEPVINTNNGAPMIKPVFSDIPAARKQQYMECLVANDTHTVEEVVEMSMLELRIAIDILFPLTTTVHTANANGSTTTHYIVKKAA